MRVRIDVHVVNGFPVDPGDPGNPAFRVFHPPHGYLQLCFSPGVSAGMLQKEIAATHVSHEHFQVKN